MDLLSAMALTIGLDLNREHFRQLAIQEIAAVHRLAYHLCNGREPAEDLVQETYLRAFKSQGDFELTSIGVRPYLFKILHNALYRRLEKEQRQPKQFEEMDSFASAAAGDGADYADTLATINWETVDERLKQAIEELPLAHRTVFLLAAVEELRYREIAEVVGVPIGTVMSRLHRARQLLADQLRGLAREHNLPITREINPDAEAASS